MPKDPLLTSSSLQSSASMQAVGAGVAGLHSAVIFIRSASTSTFQKRSESLPKREWCLCFWGRLLGYLRVCKVHYTAGRGPQFGKCPISVKEQMIPPSQHKKPNLIVPSPCCRTLGESDCKVYRSRQIILAKHALHMKPCVMCMDCACQLLDFAAQGS